MSSKNTEHMLPWGHAAFGYVLYSLYSRIRLDRPPVGFSVVALGFGTQFPDLVDKPLTWTIPLLPYGRSLAHSLFAFTAIVVALWVIFDTPNGQRLTKAFGIGYASHLVGDGLGPALSGNSLGLGYLLWPLTEVPKKSKGSFLEFFLELRFTPMMLVGFVLTTFAIGLWVYDGMPGLRDIIDERGRVKRGQVDMDEHN